MNIIITVLIAIGIFILSGLIGTCVVLYVNVRYEMKKDHTLKFSLAVIVFLLICLILGLFGMLTAFGTMPSFYYGIVLLVFGRFRLHVPDVRSFPARTDPLHRR
ncbi:hypothetical protein [Eubacterium callanderi]|uniref:hypothetical protein n=1 Tax=Eubacterium callanderi TaxID=53442 RepID=UPI0039841CB3